MRGWLLRGACGRLSVASSRSARIQQITLRSRGVVRFLRGRASPYKDIRTEIGTIGPLHSPVRSTYPLEKVYIVGNLLEEGSLQEVHHLTLDNLAISECE